MTSDGPFNPRMRSKLRFYEMRHLARERLRAGSVPTYLQEALPSAVVRRIACEAGLPQSLEVPLFEIAVAFDRALYLPPPNPAIVRGEIDRLFAAIDTLIGQLDELSVEAQVKIWDVCMVDTAGEDQDWPVWSETGVWDDLSAALKQAQNAKANIQCDPGSAGRPLSAFRPAAEAVIEAVEEQGIAMTAAELTRLIDALFSEIQVEHEIFSRSEDRDVDETPRSRDVIASILQERSLHRA